jgi:hypothetical protein
MLASFDFMPWYKAIKHESLSLPNGAVASSDLFVVEGGAEHSAGYRWDPAPIQ